MHLLAYRVARGDWIALLFRAVFGYLGAVPVAMLVDGKTTLSRNRRTFIEVTATSALVPMCLNQALSCIWTLMCERFELFAAHLVVGNEKMLNLFDKLRVQRLQRFQ